MYNYSGIFYRIWGVCGIIFLVGVMCILLERPWKIGFTLKKCKLGIGIVVFAVCLGLVYGSRILFPNISSYTGEFIETHRNSRVAPPFPVTNEYTFWNSEEKKQVFYLDVFSKNKIYPFEFVKGQRYMVYYDEFTNVIVRVDVIE